MNEYSLGMVFFNELVVYLSSFIQCTYITVPSMDKKDNGLWEGSEGKNEGEVYKILETRITRKTV